MSNLNEHFDLVCAQILLMCLLLIIGKIFFMILQHEIQYNVIHNIVMSLRYLLMQVRCEYSKEMDMVVVLYHLVQKIDPIYLVTRINNASVVEGVFAQFLLVIGNMVSLNYGKNFQQCFF